MKSGSSVPVLMYHATPDPRGGEQTAYDPHYAVRLDRFAAQVAAIVARGQAPRDVRAASSGGGCAVTFDDGDATNLLAARVLAEHGGTADFFVNSATIGTPGHLDWAAVREMDRLGMSIQSHGHTHRYFDELSPAEIRDELARSKAQIEQATGRAVVLFAPPGGRLRPEVGEIAAELGYLGLCSSRTGVWDPRDGLRDVPRLAVLASTTDERFGRWIGADVAEIRRMRARKAVLDLGKRLLGNRLYDRIRAGLVGAPGREP